MDALRRFFAVVASPRSYLNIAYLWLAFPLGLFYFIALTLGFSLGVGLLIVWVGILFGLATLLLAWAAVLIERRQIEVVLGEPLGPARLPRAADGRETIGAWARSVLGSATLWKGMLFLLLKFPLGLAGWICSLVLLTTSIALALAPIAVFFGGVVSLDGVVWDGVTSPLELAIACVVGAILFVLTLHLQNGMVAVWRWLARGLLAEGGLAQRAA
jgi:hypothetical protein